MYKTERKQFQEDLGMALINRAIAKDWTGDTKDWNGRPAWVWQRGLKPCECKECFFCLSGHMTGISHGTLKRQSQMVEQDNNPDAPHCPWERQTIRKGTKYYQVCYHRLSQQYPDKSSAWKKDKMRNNWTSKGCKDCGMTCCDTCWNPYYHPKVADE